MKILRLTLCILICASLSQSFAQTAISGVISDADDALIGATLFLKIEKTGTSTDLDGMFELISNLPGDTIEITYTGYNNYEIAVSDISGPLNVILEQNSVFLEDVVIIGYGTTKKRELTGATSVIKADEIRKTPIVRVEQALQGRAAGVQVTNLSGQPGEEPTVRIRGTSTTGEAKPLYIVDGIVVSGIDYLNPGDVERIDVLKDAATLSIYGARAANGAILITTKSGSGGQTRVSYSGYYGIQTPTNRLDLLDANQYKMMMNEGFRNAGLAEPFDENEISAHNTDWQEELFETAPMLNHHVNISGGSEKSVFNASIGYFSQEGIIGGDKSKFDRISGRFNIDSKVNDWFSFGSNIGISHIERRGISSNTSFNGAYSGALNLDPLTPVFENDPFLLEQAPYSTEPVIKNDQGTFGISEYVGGEIVNPLGLLEIQTRNTTKDQIVGGMWGEIEPISNLKFRSTISVDMAYLNDTGHRPLYYLNGAQNNTIQTRVDKGVDRFFTWQWDNTVSYSVTKENHNINALLGTSAQEYNFENVYAENGDVPTLDPDRILLNLAQDTTDIARGGATHAALLSYFGRVQYNFKDLYSLSLVLRRDGSSKFGILNRWGNFPSIGVAWNVSNESFFESDKIDVLKLRGSWGVIGNQQIPDFQFVSLLDMSARYNLGGGAEIGSFPKAVANPDIAWEESVQSNFGVDFEVFNNRLQGSIDLYNKQTKGLLDVVPIPLHVGLPPSVSNSGEVRNRGIEFGLSWRNTGKSLSYSIGANAAYNQNEMIFIGNAEKVIIGASWAVAGAVTRSEEGLPIAYFWGYKTDGIFQNQSEVFQHINSDGQPLQSRAVPGDVRFVDFNGDGKLDDEDKTMIGSPHPDWVFGFNSSFEYKNFDLSIFLQGTIGNEIFNGSQRQDLRYTNRTTEILERWTEEGSTDVNPRFTFSDVNNNYRVSDLYIENGSHLRLKNLQLGYNFGPKALGKMGAQNFRIYVSTDNILTITGYKGVDPEIGALTAFDIGIDRGIYPQPRTTRFGVDITF